ncbi:MAG: response regulator transcription factor [Erysipelotrichaceae bacterium]|nr:response regulator transcription factor [Erysipelotrichaceae bacterium]
MMRIAIVDDEQVFRKQLRDGLGQYGFDRNLDIFIDEYDSGSGFLESNKEFDIVFLDYQMQGLNGIETAELLRKRDQKITIIFLSSYPQMVFKSFEVNTYRFLIKPYDKKAMYDSLDSYLKMIELRCPIVLKVNGLTVRYEADDILYIEAQDKFCDVCMKNERFSVGMPLANIFDMLPKESFTQPHRSFVVNMYAIKKFDTHFVTMVNGDELPISRIQLKSFKSTYQTFCQRYLF